MKLDKGQRIIMALNAGQVCQIGVTSQSQLPQPAWPRVGKPPARRRPNPGTPTPMSSRWSRSGSPRKSSPFRMEHVREILRVETPKQVPDVPEYVLGVLTVRGQILPIVDLRRLLQQRSLAEEFADQLPGVREDYERWLEQMEKSSPAVRRPRWTVRVAERSASGWPRPTARARSSWKPCPRSAG